MKNIFIIGASHHNTLSVVRCIGETYGQVSLIIIGSANSFVAKSKYVNSTVYLKNIEELYIWAVDNKSNEKKIIISCADGVSQIFDIHYKEFTPYYDFFNAKVEGRITFFMDKQKQVELAKDAGFQTPVSACYINTDSVGSFSTFPCIVKPLQSYIGGKHIWHCKNLKELQHVIKSAPNGVTLQVQELIENIHEIVLPGLITKDQIFVPGYILKHREFLGATTYSSVKKHNSKTEKLVEFTLSMLRKIGYEGLFGVEAIYNGNDYFFIELNLRNDATCYSMKVAGVNLPAMYVDYVEGQLKAATVISEITSIVENKDFSHVLRNKINLFQWIKELSGAKCKFIFDKHDMMPLFFSILYQFKNKLRI